MPRRVVCVLVLLQIVSSARSHADTYGPFKDFREVDATGRYYVVVKRIGEPVNAGPGTPVTFQIAERRPGSPPIAAAADEGEGFEKVVANPDVKVRDGDIVLGKGQLERCPGFILISSTGLGFVGLDVSGYNYGSLENRDALVIVSSDGTVRHRKALIDLFSAAEVSRFLRSAGGIWWCGGGWIDERRKQVVVVGSDSGPEFRRVPRLFRVVDLTTGEVRKADSEVVQRALSELNAGGLEQALELAGELKLERAKGDLVKILDDAKSALDARVRAAVALAAIGDRRGAELMRRTALEKSGPGYYAVSNLPAVLGDEAAPVLCDVVRRHGEKYTLAPWQAMHAVSAKAAVPPLLELLREGKLDAINFAIECLADKGPEAAVAVPELIKVLNSEPHKSRLLSSHDLAAIALGRIGPAAKEALPTLRRHAEERAPEELKKVLAKVPELQDDHFGGKKYSDDYYVDAYCKVRGR